MTEVSTTQTLIAFLDEKALEFSEAILPESVTVITPRMAKIRHLAKMYRAAADAVRFLQSELDTTRAQAIVAEHHKTLSLLGKPSWQEVVEQDLRVKLAEAEIRAEAAEAEVARLTQARGEKS